jgi:nicotinamide riboside kinase
MGRTRPAAVLVAVLGAESTGKTTLVQGIANRLLEQPGWRADDIGVVPESLRRFCDEQGRTPRADEQAGLAREQARKTADALARHRLVLADTTALMTAVYSDFVFGDRSLYPMATRLHARVDLTLVTALDLPWVADGMQRDGPQVREPVDALVRCALADAGIEWAVVHGRGEHRVTRALRAMRAVLMRQGTWPGEAVLSAQASASGPAVAERRVRWRAACECCEGLGWAGLDSTASET